MKFQLLCILLGVVAFGSACYVDNPSWVGDGYCDDTYSYNTEDCDYDGGDCCEESCVSTYTHTCGDARFNCLDPRYQHEYSSDDDSYNSDDTFFVYIHEAKNWYEARAYCEVRGGYLADIRDSAENDEAYEVCSQGGWDYDYSQDCWIGYMSDYNDREPFEWSSGSSYSYENWAWGEPSESYDSCARFKSDDRDAYWYDRACDAEYAFICEFPYDEVRLICNLQPTRDTARDLGIEISGDITMDLDPDGQGGGRVTIDIDLSGAGMDNEYHGIHIHEGRELSNDGLDCLGHFNPGRDPHGCHPFEVRHAGDIGNVASYDGGYSIVDKFKIDDVFDRVPDFVGRCMILHAQRDNCQGDEDDITTTGDAGGRYSQCLIDVEMKYKLLEREETPKSQFKTNYTFAVSAVAVGGSALAIAGLFVFVKRLRRKNYNRVETQAASV